MLIMSQELVLIQKKWYFRFIWLLWNFYHQLNWNEQRKQPDKSCSHCVCGSQRIRPRKWTGNDHVIIISQRMHCVTLHKLCSAFQRWKYPSKDTAPSSWKGKIDTKGERKLSEGRRCREAEIENNKHRQSKCSQNLANYFLRPGFPLLVPHRPDSNQGHSECQSTGHSSDTGWATPLSIKLIVLVFFFIGPADFLTQKEDVGVESESFFVF